MKKSAPTMQKLQKEDVKQAVIVDYKAIGCKSPERGKNKKPFIQYSLEWLLIEKFDEVFICCLPHNSSELREFVRNFIKIENVPSSMTIQIHSSEENHSTGDCVRDLDVKNLIKTDFIIMDVGCCGNLPLSDMLESHKRLKKVDKNVILTSVVRNIFTKDPEIIGEFPVYVIEPKTGCLLHYSAGRVSVDDPNEVASRDYIELSAEMFFNHDSVKIYNNLSSTNLSIYSSNLPALFAEFFDCRTEASLIKAALSHQETLGYSIYIHVVDDLFSQHMADMGFVINQKLDQFDTKLIYKRSERHDTLRQLVNKSLIGCTRLNPVDYLANLADDDNTDDDADEEEELKSDSDLEEYDDDDDDAYNNQSSRNIQSFLDEVLDSLIRGFEEKINHKNLILEVNASKHAYNISIEDIHSTIAKVLLLLPCKLNPKITSQKEYFDSIKKAILVFKLFLHNYFSSFQSKITLLSTWEDIYLSNDIAYLSDGALAILIYQLYYFDVLDEESIIEWHSQIPCNEKNDQKSREELRKKEKIVSLVNELSKEEEEEEDDDEGDDEDEDN